MALTETQVEDKIEVVGDHKHVQVRTATVIARDGTEISRSFHRHVLSCSTKSGDTWADTDISDQSTEVQAICNAVWTDAVKTAYQTAMDAAEIQETNMSRARDTADQINRVNSSAADATAITVDSSENVGIGTSSPSSYYSTDLVVTVPDEGGITLVNDTTHTSYLMFADGTSGADRYRGQLSYDHNVNEMAFATNGNERMRIDSVRQRTYWRLCA